MSMMMILMIAVLCRNAVRSASDNIFVSLM